MLIRLRSVVVVAAALMLVTGCGEDKKDPAQFVDGQPAARSAPPKPPSAARAIPEKTAAGKAEIAKNPDGTINSADSKPVTAASTVSAAGLGPYKIGATLKELQDEGLVNGTKALRADNCPGYAGATGTAKYHEPELVFFKDRLLRMAFTGTDVATSRGVKVGSKSTVVKDKYPDGKQIDNSIGIGAWLSTVGDYGLLFELDGDKVTGVQAGMAEPMQFKYTDDQGC